MARTWTARLHCPIAPACNAAIDAVQAWTEKWVVEFNLVRDQQGLHRYRSYRLHQCVAFAHPYAELEVLKVISDATTWFIISDDHYDESDLGRDPERMSRLMRRFIDIARTRQLPEQPNNLERSIHDVCTRVFRYGAEFYDFFRSSLEIYWFACLEESRFRDRTESPRVEEYLEVRSTAVGMNCLFDLIVVEQGIAPSLLKHEHALKMRAMCSSLVALVNDLDSFDKESFHRDPNNLCSVLVATEGLSIEAARDKVVQLHNALMGEFLRATEAVPPGDEFRRYARGLRHWVRAVFDWEQISGRYDFLDNAQKVLPTLHLASMQQPSGEPEVGSRTTRPARGADSPN